MPRAPLAGLRPDEIQQELRRGGRFVIYYYCVTVFFWSFKKPSRILLLRPGYNDIWQGMPASVLGHHPFWRGVPYSLVSLLLGGPLVAIGGVLLTWGLFAWNLPGEQEINVLIVLPAFVLTFWGLPWGYIYLFSCLVSNCRGGQDVTAEVATLLGLAERPTEDHPGSNIQGSNGAGDMSLQTKDTAREDYQGNLPT